MKKTASKIMALLWGCLMLLLPIGAHAIGANNFQTVLESEEQKTLGMLKDEKAEINDELQLLKKELTTSKHCALERLKTITSLVLLTRLSLLEREAILKGLKDTRSILDTKTIKGKGETK